jgi:hypothetical protein
MGQRRAIRTALGTLALGASSAAVWWLWLGHDTEYQIDPVTGIASGPYEAWQVVGCVLTLAVLAFAAGLVARPWIVVPIMTVSFTIAWAAQASQDETGLWLVGATMVFVGMALGSTLLSGSAWLGSTMLRRGRVAAGAGAVSVPHPGSSGPTNQRLPN